MVLKRNILNVHSRYRKTILEEMMRKIMNKEKFETIEILQMEKEIKRYMYSKNHLTKERK
jgi:hypothetical protein